MKTNGAISKGKQRSWECGTERTLLIDVLLVRGPYSAAING